MLDPEVSEDLKAAIRLAVDSDRSELQVLRRRISGLRQKIQRIQPRRSAAISLVGTDGGNNRVAFDPFAIDLVRVVDSSDNQYCLEALTPAMDVKTLDERHFDEDGQPKSSLGRMLHALELRSLGGISNIIATDPEKRSPIWIQIYRELTEWAVLLDLVRERQFASDTVILFDGFLRSKKFEHGYFGEFQKLIDQAITEQYIKHRRRIFLAGVAKHNQFLQKYRLAMALEGVMRNSYACFVPIDDELQKTAYKWEEIVTGGGEGESFNAGQMFLVKFGSHSHDPVWAIDIFKPQASQASAILGYLLSDAQEGFPVPLYPMCLQKAHEKAALIGLDQDILQDEIMSVVRESLDLRENWILNELSLQPADPSQARY
jgi:hypothetical protein